MKKFILEIDSNEEIKEKLQEGLVKTFEGEGVAVSVEEEKQLTEEEKEKKLAEEAEEEKLAEEAKAEEEKLAEEAKIEEKKKLTEEIKKELAEEAEKENMSDTEIKDKKIEELTMQFDEATTASNEKDKKIAELEEKVGILDDEVKKSSQAGEEAEKELKDYKSHAKTESIKSFVKQSLEEGKILPKDESVIVALMEGLDDKSLIKFTQEDKEVSEPQVEVLKKFISELPKAVDFSEIAPQIDHKIEGDAKVSIGGVQYDVDNVELVQKAEKYAEDNKVGFDVALMEVSK